MRDFFFGKKVHYSEMVLFFCSLACVCLAAYFLKGALPPFLLAFFFAYLLRPILPWLVRRGFSDRGAFFFVYVMTLFVLGTVFLAVLPRLVYEGALFVQYLPDILLSLFNQLQIFLLSLNIPGLESVHLKQLFQRQMEALSLGSFSGMSGVFNHLGSQLVGLVVSIVNYLLFPIFFYYLLSRFSLLSALFLSLIPQYWRTGVSRFLSVTDTMFGGYIRGQVTVSCILAILYAVGLSVVGLRYGALIGMMTGLLNVIPYFGFSVGFLSGMVVAVFSDGGLFHVGIVLAVFLGIQSFESFFLTPRIVGHYVGIDPFLAMLSLIVGGNLLGLFGMVLAIPVAGILKVGYDTWLKKNL